MGRLAEISLRHARLTGAVLLLITLGLGAGLPSIQTEFGYRPLLGGDHPSIRRLENFIDGFGGGLPLLVVWSCTESSPCTTVFDEPSLRMAETLEKRLAELPGVKRVSGPASSSLLVAEPGGYSLRRFIERGEIPGDSNDLAAHAMKNRLWERMLVSSDGKVGAITVELADSRSTTMEEAVGGIVAAIPAFEAQGYAFYLTGHPIESVVAGQDLTDSMAVVTPMAMVIIAIVLFLLTRSVRVVAFSLATVGVAVAWTFGLLGWLQWPNDSILQILSTLILTIGACDAMHFIARAASAAQNDPALDRKEAILLAAREVGRPCALTTVTTAGAFLSFLTSDFATFVRFGALSAFGIGACLVLTFTLLPLLLFLVQGDLHTSKSIERTWRDVLDAIASLAQRRAKPIVAGALVLTLLFGYGWLTKLSVDTDINEMWGSQSRVTRWIRFVDSNLRGLDSLEVWLHLPDASFFPNPEVQSHLERFTTALEGIPGLGRATSIQTLMSELNRVLHDDDPEFERTADSLGGNAELLELLSFDDPSRVEPWLSRDYSQIRISLEGPSATARDRGAVLDDVSAAATRILPPDWGIQLTGPFAMEFDWVTAIQDTQTRSFTTALAIVFVIVALALRSIPLAMLSMVPAVLPVVVALGIMGFSEMSLDVGRVMIAAVVIGIAVDDSIHLLTAYEDQRSRGASRAAAMRESIVHVGRALVLTSAALGLGFLSFLLTPWQTIASFGLFLTIAVFGALAATLLVVPAIIFLLDRERPAEQEGLPARDNTVQSGSRKAATILLAATPVALAIGLGIADVARNPATRLLPCWVLPNGVILIFLSGYSLPTRTRR